VSVTRVVAETGLIFVQFPVSPGSLMDVAMHELPWRIRTTIASRFFTTAFFTLFTNEPREAMPVFTSHAMRVADLGAYEQQTTRNRGVRFTLCIILALFVGYFVAWGSMLYCEYNYAATLDRVAEVPINKYTMTGVGQGAALEAWKYDTEKPVPPVAHNRVGHLLFGAGLTTFLSALRLRFVNWPLHPVGYLMVYGDPMRNMWFSIMIAWLVKVLILKFGGAKMFRSARPFFVGLIMGEAGAAAFWLVVSLVRVSLGLEYQIIRLLPAS